MAETMAELNKGVSNVTSSDEQIIGTYNGKPRYRKEYDCSLTNTGTALESITVVSDQNWNIDKLLVFNGNVIEPNGTWGCSLPYVYNNAQQAVSLALAGNSGQKATRIVVYMLGWSAGTRNCHIVMEYTKS